MSTTLRRLASSLLLAAVAAFATGACAVDEPAPADCRAPIDLWLDATEVAGPAGPLTKILVPGDEPVTIEGGACDCTTSECRDAFVEENLGCGVCVTFNCDGQRIGACVACGDPPGGEQEAHSVRPDHAELDGSGAAPSEATMTEPRHARPLIDLAAIGSACGKGFTCSAGLSCMTGGISPQKPQSSCELACPLGKKQCPTGTACVTIFDGPGRVCRPTFVW